MQTTIQAIKKTDNQTIAKIIRTVGAEFGAIGDGFGPSDPEVECMSGHYLDETMSLYLVALVDGEVVGGCGIAAFAQQKSICELRKLFLLPGSRGLGLGKQLAERCLDYAQSKGYQSCYLDTLSNMDSAINLYKKLGFIQLIEPLAGTEHNGCDVWMLKEF